MTAGHRQLVEQTRALARIDRLAEWSCINSGSTNLPGLTRMAGLIAGELEVLPGSVEELPGTEYAIIDCDGISQSRMSGCHLRCIVRPKAPLQMLFTGHMDTVFAAGHPFQDCVLDKAKGLLRGPGVADMKGGILVLLSALQALEAEAAIGALGYTVLINGDEEIGSPASAALIEAEARGKDAAFTFEPALPDGHLVCSRPGNGNFSIVVEGRSAHAGRNIDEGRNAVAAAAQLGLGLVDMLGASFPANIAAIDGGAPFNTVPDRAVLRMNLRPGTPTAMERARQILQELIARIESMCDVKIAVVGGFSRPPKPSDDRTLRLLELVRDSASELGLAIGWRPSGGVCDGNNIASCGVPVVDTMGVVGGAIHTDNEYMICDSLAERAAIAAVAIQRIAQGELRTFSNTHEGNS